MKTPYREPQVEEGLRNIILQNRCGNRLTVLCFAEGSALEFVYKPNAFRRKEFHARNFSHRDNLTELFADVRLPELRTEDIQQIDYDPFHTALATRTPSGANNQLSFINVADENVFALTARCPLLLTITPRRAFSLEEGLLYESFSDRCEEIISFISFAGIEANRYRVLADGRHVLQLLEHDVILFGGEENIYQMRRALDRLRGLNRETLLDRNERLLAPVLAQSALSVRDAEMARVVEVNRRLAYSGLDEGGACFGALNRIYHLIWLRDGSMTAGMFAHAGNPAFARLWTPFALHNPATRRTEDGRNVREYLQLLGTRWSKAEDDGLYYLLYALHAHVHTSGDDTLLHADELAPVLEALDGLIATRWNAELRLFGSDTYGEDTLGDSPYYGYDVVNGTLTPGAHMATSNNMAYVYTVYLNVSFYNMLCIAETLIAASPDLDPACAARYRALREIVEQSIAAQCVDETGKFYLGLVRYRDGSEKWLRFEELKLVDWEYVWACSLGPYYPHLPAALASARAIYRERVNHRRYGYCPRCTLATFLKQFGLSSSDYRALLDEQIHDALLLTEKYPMRGALTEYVGEAEGWRGLPFGAGTFINSITSLLLQGLPAGVAVRASDLVDGVQAFTFHVSRIHAEATGDGDVVGAVSLNGTALTGTLQLPESLLRAGKNLLRVQRSAVAPPLRLFASNARLLAVEAHGDGYAYVMTCATRADLIFDGCRANTAFTACDVTGAPLAVEMTGFTDCAGIAKTLVIVRGGGEFTLIAQ